LLIGIAVFESIELIPWGLFLGSFLLGLLVRRWWILIVSLLLAFPFLGIGLGLWEQGGDVTGVWHLEMSTIFSISASGLVVGVAIGRLILHPRRKAPTDKEDSSPTDHPPQD
jgi:hypothetical protein